ncbi:DUF4160 domain-containing protein [Clostridium tagluense]|uniref:DUF4160 domain-containing protein n=1 Tax=Clostridium tagluense TaxID=360422 RepID=UPI001C6EEB6F|nr:DUF4160 domain-containing protein [Clostridium tagluense]MBW9158646.1 DUF4160 domain-containing protein [Clostridium tagluense]WLC68546.1 DUF4160 domain-containing protein [Clostridium tagluense]
MNIESELKSLQADLSIIDLLNRKNTGDMTEFLVAKLQDIKLKMYQEIGHDVPHIHVDYGNYNHIASYSINTGERFVVSPSKQYDKKYDKKITAWIIKNKKLLLELWNSVKRGIESHYLIAEIRGNT